MGTKRVTTGELKIALAAALNLPERKIDYPHLRIQQAGYIAKGKRGRGGVDVSPRDSATTLIAVLGAFISDEVLIAVRDFSGLQVAHTAHIIHAPSVDGRMDTEGWSDESTAWQFAGYNIPHLQGLPAGHTFADALTALIEAARDGAFEAAIMAASPNTDIASHGIEVTFSGPEPAAVIEIDLTSNGRSYKETATYLLTDPTFSIERHSAFKIAVTIDHQSVYAVAKLFRERTR